MDKKEIIVPDSRLNKNLLGKNVARLLSVQALFQMEASDTSLPDILLEFENHRLEKTFDGHIYHNPDHRLFRKILEQVINDQRKIDQLINNSLKKTWELDRIDPTLRSIFRASTAEFLMFKTPPKVVISEFLTITQAFFPVGKEIKLVNGVLDYIINNVSSGNIK